MFVTSDNGASWVAVNNGLPKNSSDTTQYVSILSLAVSGTSVFAGTELNHLYLSTNDGASWSKTPYPVDDVPLLAVSGADLYAGSWGNGIFEITNSGTSWTVYPGGLQNTYVYTLNVVFAGMLAVETGIGAFLVHDNSYFTKINNPLNVSTVNAFISLDTILFEGSSGGVYYSVNKGSDWLRTSLKNHRVLAFDAYGANLFAGTVDSGVFVSTDGTNWTAVDSGLTDMNVDHLAVFGSNLFAATDNCVWRRPLSEMITAVKDKGNNVPFQFSLSQNYPNPFNPTTVISYELPTNSFVVLKVFDVLGREVKSLVTERETAGNHSVAFNASNLPSGVYFYRLQAGSLMETKKLVLLK